LAPEGVSREAWTRLAGCGDTPVGNDAFDILDDNGGLDVVDNKFVFIAAWIDAT
jgi:hypothetical protein